MHLLSYVVASPKSNIAFLFGALISICLLVVVAMIRFDSAVLVIGLCLPCALFLFFKHTCLIKDVSSRRRYILKYFIVVMVASMALLGLRFYNNEYYKNALQWQNWFALNNAKAQFLDYKKVKYNKETERLFAAVGWGKADFLMIMGCQYVDPVSFSADKFNTVINPLIELHGGLGKTNRWDHLTTSFVRNAGVIVKRSGTVLILLLLCIVVFIRREKINFIYVALILIAVIGIYAYLYLVVFRSPFRVLVLCWITALWLLMLISANDLRHTHDQWRHSQRIFVAVRYIVVLLLLGLGQPI